MSTVFYPMLVSVAGSDDLVSVWSKFDTLPKNVQDILTADILPKKLEQLSNQLSFDEEVALFVSVLVRNLFFQEVSLQKATEHLTEFLGKKNRDVRQVGQVIDFIQKEILTINPSKQIVQNNPSESVKTVAKEGGYVRLSLLKALAEYPKLNEQLITNEKIRLKSQPDLVRPNLANWIRYYRDELGIGFHDQVTRGKFLFQSENGKRLSNDERERINLILKSLEEEFPIDINPDQNSIVFPVRTQPSPVSSTFPVRQGTSGFPRPKSSIAGISPLETQSISQGVLARPESPASTTKPSFLNSKFGPGKNIAGETLHFSTGHVLPSERQSSVSLAPAPSQPMPATPSSAMSTPSISMAGISQNRGAALPRSPYSIRPLRMRDDTNHETENR